MARANYAGDGLRTVERVAAGQTVARGRAVALSSGTVQETNTALYGVAMKDADGDGASPEGSIGAPGYSVGVAMFGSNAIVPMVVGTGGVTMGSPVRLIADGVTDATIGGGTGAIFVAGTATQTGAPGNLVGINIGSAGYCVGS